MFEIILQLHAHKKGTGSSHNGRDSNAQRLGTKHHDTQLVTAGSSSFVNVVLNSIRATMLAWARTTLFMLRLKVALNLNAKAATNAKSVYILLKKQQCNLHKNYSVTLGLRSFLYFRN